MLLWISVISYNSIGKISGTCFFSLPFEVSEKSVSSFSTASGEIFFKNRQSFKKLHGWLELFIDSLNDRQWDLVKFNHLRRKLCQIFSSAITVTTRFSFTSWDKISSSDETLFSFEMPPLLFNDWTSTWAKLTFMVSQTSSLLVQKVRCWKLQYYICENDPKSETCEFRRFSSLKVQLLMSQRVSRF